jgi:hypothetical protein
MVLHDLNWLSKIGKAVIVPNKKPIIAKHLVDKPMFGFPEAKTAGIRNDLPTVLVKE